MSFDTLIQLFERLVSAFARPWEVLVELLLIGLSVNWCAGVLHGTRGTRLLRGLLILLVAVTLIVRVLAAQLGWTRLELLYRYFVLGLAFIALVAFQPELRRALIRAGDVPWLRRGKPRDRLVAALVESAGHLSRNRHGALVAVQRDVGLINWVEHGTPISAEVSANLLNTIFFPNSPLHDLGVIVRGEKVLAAGCQFPMAESGEVDAGLGSRHRAAVGLSQESDALVMVVSEETGVISLADRGHLIRHLTLSDLERELRQRLFGDSAPPTARRRLGWVDVKRFVRRTALVLPLTLVIWFLADQASMTARDGVPLQLNVLHDNAIAVDLQQPATPAFTVTITGATRDVDAIRSATQKNPLAVDWNVRPPYSKPGVYTLSGDEIAAFLNALPALRARGVSVSNVSPETLRFEVDELVTVKMSVQAVSAARRLIDVRCEPAEVQVTMRKGDAAHLDDSTRVVRALLDQQLATAPPVDQPLALESVQLDLRIGTGRATRIDPPSVRVSARVVGETARRRIPGIAVQVLASVPFLQKYEVTVADPGEWLLEVEVEGDRNLVERLRPQDVSAYLPLSSELPTSDFRTADVTVVLPPGVQLVGRPRQIQYRLNPRETVNP